MGTCLGQSQNDMQVNEFPLESDFLTDDDFIGLDAAQGGGNFQTQKFKAAKMSKRGNLVYVDSVLGDDAKAARGRTDRPFKTLVAAKTAAVAGDCVLVRPGTFNETNLLKNDVNWLFMPGATVAYTGAGTEAIFDDGGSAIECNIWGQGNFSNTGSNSAGVIDISNLNSAVTLQGMVLTVANNGIAVNLSAGNLVIRATSIISTGNVSAGVATVSGGNLLLRVEEVSADIPSLALSGNGSAQIFAHRLTANLTNAINATGSGSLYLASDFVVANLIGISAFGSGIYTLKVGEWDCVQPSVTVGGTAYVTVEGGRTVFASGTAMSASSTTATLVIIGARLNGNILLLGGNNNLIIKDTVVVAPAVNSIDVGGAGTCDVRVYGSFVTNTAVDAAVVFLVGGATVDADVIFA